MNPLVRTIAALSFGFVSLIAAADAIRTLTPAQVHAQMAKQQIQVFDANLPEVFARHHVPGATHVEYDRVKASDLPQDKSAPIVFYCMNEQCGASPVAAKTAVKLGWKNVYLMPAGIEGWIAARLPVESAH
ncbi:MAG TPA: rhodanese-like domain-containing protein [Steroidobacteraceae bacterium]|nr:rhodanese-like domain-containing protein [Steroidobacteraceae bacterium]